MSRLLFVFEREMPTVSITRDVYAHLKHFPEIKADFVKLTDVNPKDIDLHDVIIFLRPMCVYAWRIARRAREAGHCVITFCDDDQLNLPPELPTIRWRKKGLLRTLKNSDVIASTSNRILSAYCPLTAGKRAARQDTIVQEEELPSVMSSRADGEPVRIVYAAAGSHAGLFEKYIGPVLKELFHQYGTRISLTFVGVHPRVEGIPCEYVPAMPLDEYRHYMKSGHFDIGVAPLHTDDFSRCKYFNKFLEYTTQGIPAIYTNTEPYSDVIRNDETGLLCDNTPETWKNALRKMIDDPAARTRMAKGAAAYIREHHNEQAIFGKYIEAVPEIGAQERDWPAVRPFRIFRLFYYFSLPFEWLVLTFFHVRRRGIGDVFKRAMVHIKRREL